MVQTSKIGFVKFVKSDYKKDVQTVCSKGVMVYFDELKSSANCLNISLDDSCKGDTFCGSTESEKEVCEYIQQITYI